MYSNHILKDVEESSSEEQQESDTNIEVYFTVDEERQECTGRSELETEDRSYKEDKRQQNKRSKKQSKS